MAKPILFPQANMNLAKPVDMTAEQCASLPAFSGTNPDGFPMFVSAWKLDPEEIEEVKRTGIIYLHVIGKSHPPVYVSSINPFDKESE